VAATLPSTLPPIAKNEQMRVAKTAIFETLASQPLSWAIRLPHGHPRALEMPTHILVFGWKFGDKPQIALVTRTKCKNPPRE
jgi:hypothetical protein